MTSTLYYIVTIIVIVLSGMVSIIVHLVRKNDKIKQISDKMPDLLGLIPRVDNLESRVHTVFLRSDSHKEEIQNINEILDLKLKSVEYTNGLILRSIDMLASHLDAKDVTEFLNNKTYRIFDIPEETIK